MKGTGPLNTRPCCRPDCGHPQDPHNHHRAGTDCSLCPPGGCPRYLARPPRPGRRLLAGWTLSLASVTLTGYGLVLLGTGYTGPGLVWLGLAAVGLVWAGSAVTGNGGHGGR